MRLSQFPLVTTRESPADAETISHQLMLRSGMIRKLAAGIYTWAPLGLRVLRRVEQVVREEMERAGAVEMLMPAIQPQELWETTGRWEKFGGQLLKIRDRRGQWFCFGPTHEEVVTEYAKETLKSWRQLPLTVFQIQTKFRDEIRPRFGVMRAREFLMKDAYSFHLDDADLDREYQNMFDTYGRIFSRLGLDFRAVSADTGAIGGSASHEFHVLADSGEDLIAFSDGSNYAANVELAEARSEGGESLAQGNGGGSTRVATPGVHNISELASHFGVSACVCVKTLILQGADGPVAVTLRGDHELNHVKAGKQPELGDAATLLEADAVRQAVGCGVGSIGPLTLPAAMPLLIDRAAAALPEFICGAGEDGFHLQAASWSDLAPDHPYRIVDLRNVVDGDLSPDGHGKLRLARGIEVGHVFALGRTYAEAFGVTVQNEAGQPSTPAMGCYGIGISRIVAAAIEQNHDAAGIIWPPALAPWDVVVAMINPKDGHPEVVEAAERLVAALEAAGRSVILDDRGLRPGAMFADLELIGIPHRVVVSPRGIEQGEFEYRARASQENEMLGFDDLIHRLTRPAP